MAALAAVIFDFDGVVLDSETPEYESHRRLYEQCGVPLTIAEWCDAIGLWSEGHDDRRFDALSSRAASAPPRARYHAERRRIFEALLPPQPMRGISELLAALDEASVPAAIASTAPARWVVPAAERIGLRARFSAIVTGDVYLEAARQLGVDPSRAVAIEDSAPGVAAARAAGMAVVAIPHWLTETHDLTAAHLVVAHAGELTVERLQRLIADC